ncbi:MAG: sulfotransferase [Myxococcota bacterium]
MALHRKIRRRFERAHFRGRILRHQANPLDERTTRQPVVVGALGGSGTRAIVELLVQSGVFMGGAQDPDRRDSLFIRSFFKEHFDRLANDPSHDTAEMRADLYRVIRAHRVGISEEGAAWGWKNPRSVWTLPFLARVYPGMRFIHLVRDGRDMALSRNHFLLNRHGRAILGPDWEGDVLRDQFHLWALANERAAKAGAELLGERALIVRYEDLCADPQAELRRILDLIECELPAGRIDDIATRVKASPGIGRGRANASPELAACVERHRSVLRDFGYLEGESGE